MVQFVNGFTVTRREAGANSYFMAKRANERTGRTEVFTRKNLNSLRRFLASK
jgi:hypothetical protein